MCIKIKCVFFCMLTAIFPERCIENGIVLCVA
jgi:hypothetical protein